MTLQEYIRYIRQLKTGREAIAKWLSEQMGHELDDTKKWLDTMSTAPIEHALKMLKPQP